MSHNPPRSAVFGRWNRVQIMKHFKCHCTLEVQLYLLVSRHYFPLPRCHWLHSHSLHKFHFSTPEKVRIWPKLKKGTQKSRKDGLGLQEQFCERVNFLKVSSGRLSSLANVSSDNSEPSPFKAAVFPWKKRFNKDSSWCLYNSKIGTEMLVQNPKIHLV